MISFLKYVCLATHAITLLFPSSFLLPSSLPVPLLPFFPLSFLLPLSFLFLPPSSFPPSLLPTCFLPPSLFISLPLFLSAFSSIHCRGGAHHVSTNLPLRQRSEVTGRLCVGKTKKNKGKECACCVGTHKLSHTHTLLSLPPMQIRINVPSYCDRVLWKSYPGTNISNTSYGNLTFGL